jgi:hypothetical protein
MEVSEMSCPLCTIPERRHEEKILFEDKEIMVVETKTKKGHKERLMILVKDHKTTVEDHYEKKLITRFSEIIMPRFSWAKEFYIFGKNNTIKDHWHKIASDKNEKAEDFQELFCQPRDDLIKVQTQISQGQVM